MCVTLGAFALLARANGIESSTAVTEAKIIRKKSLEADRLIQRLDFEELCGFCIWHAPLVLWQEGKAHPLPAADLISFPAFRTSLRGTAICK